MYCILLLLFVVASTNAAMVKYDQRQEGEWNVRADLENFVIVIIPTSSQQSAATPPATGLSLLDLLSKAVPSRSHSKRKHLKKTTTEAPQDTEAFIESKTAPYHVDISRSRDNLAKLHPLDLQTEEQRLTSPTISLLKSGELTLRSSKGFIAATPQILEELVKEEKLTLLGAKNEQCGPGYQRDEKGVCQLKEV